MAARGRKGVASTRKRVDTARKDLRAFRDAVAKGRAPAALRRRAEKALLYLGGQGDPPTDSLRDYDHRRYGPFLGVSDEGSAAGAIREAALRSPKVRALGPCPPLAVGVALDAERLGAVGETPVGPAEYARIRVECMGRILNTTNVGTRVNLRFFKRYPVVTVPEGAWKKLAPTCKARLLALVEPFAEAPGGARPITAYVEFKRTTRRSRPARVRILEELAAAVRSHPRTRRDLHRVGVLGRIGLGPKGRDAALFAMNLARSAGLDDVLIDGVMSKEAQDAGGMPGLRNYLAAGLVGPLLRHATKHHLRLRTRNTVDPETVARSIWTGLNTARGMGLELGKYGVFPLTLEETDRVVACIQDWCGTWSAAPVFFVDQGLLASDRVYAGRDVAAGVRRWLDTVAGHGVRVVLIDTMDKGKGWRLYKRDGDPKGILGPRQIRDLDAYAAKLGVRALWAGGISLPLVYEFGRMRVFGIYVTSAAAQAGPVRGEYELDPLLATLKEPTREGVALAKLMLEAGFLVSELGEREPGPALRKAAEAFVRELERPDPPRVAPRALDRLVADAWRRRGRGRR